MRKKRAFLLILVLLITLILLVAGFGFLGKRVGQYRSTLERNSAFQAKWLALAGMQDVKSKLYKDFNFPPPGGSDQQVFTYSEPVTAPDGSGTLVGSFQITIDQTYVPAPYAIYVVTSLGIAGDPNSPLTSTARHKIVAELDINPNSRSTGNPPNPNFFQWINWTDYSSF